MQVLHQLVEKIAELDPKHGHKLQKELSHRDELYFRQADRFLSAFKSWWEEEKIGLAHVASCYVRMREDMQQLYQEFIRTESYPNTSFEEVRKAIYEQPEIMEYHMHGLTLAQFLWPDQYERFRFFSEYLEKLDFEVRHYLEIGAGHGLYLQEAIRILEGGVRYDVVDVSPTSIELSQNLVRDNRVNFMLADVFDLDPITQYDLIVMGELIEHLEDPLAMLKKARELLTPEGQIYVTTPANAPMIDHIYLFRNAEEIRSLVREAGLEIIAESKMYADNMPAEIAERFKLPMMYAAFLKAV